MKKLNFDLKKIESLKKINVLDTIKKVNLLSSVKKINLSETVKKINLSETVKKINLPETVKKINLSETIKKINLPEAVKKIDLPETVKKIDLNGKIKKINDLSTDKIFKISISAKSINIHGKLNIFKKEVRLIPFKVQEVYKDANEIPQGVEMINAPAIWEESKKGDGVVIAVVDTGCQSDHPDLKDRIIGGRNFTDDYSGDVNNYNDNNGHGTHVAGTIAASENNIGVLGVAPQSKLLILKVLGGDGSGNYNNIINAIQYAIKWRGSNNEKVRIISMSLGGSSDIPKLHSAVKDAVSNDVMVICASGNDGDNNSNTDEYNYPASYNEAISVGAVDFDKKMAQYSNSNYNVDLVAPGNNILSTYIGSKYAKLSGTSMATPHVSGAAALIINKAETEFGRTLTEAELYAQLVKRTTTLGFDKKNEGNGLLDLSKD